MTHKIPGNLLTTAMAVMPHTDVGRALDLALSLDVPFWPQLPNYNYHEDMYVQAAEHFPGILLDMDKRTLRFSMDKFGEELEGAFEKFDDPAYFDVSETYSAVYHRFLGLDLIDKAQKAVLGSSSSENPTELSQKEVHSVKLDSRANVGSWKKRLSGWPAALPAKAWPR